MMCPFITINHFGTKNFFSYPQESDNTILFSILVLVLLTLFIVAIGMPFNQFNQEEMNLDILSKLLILSLSQNKYVDWYEFVTNSTFSVNIASFGIFIASSLYKPIYSSLHPNREREKWNL